MPPVLAYTVLKILAGTAGWTSDTALLDVAATACSCRQPIDRLRLITAAPTMKPATRS